MKNKRNKNYKKKNKPWKVFMYTFFILTTLISTYLFFKSYYFISNIPEANNITQEEIYRLTRIEETDIRLMRALKNDAFDSWLYEANDEKVRQLSNNEKILLDIIEGQTKISTIDDVMDNLKKSIDMIEDTDIEELYILYYKKILPEQYSKANTAFQEMTITNIEKPYQDIVELLDLLNKIYNQKGMLAVTNDQNFKNSVSLLEEVNKNFLEVNTIKEKVYTYDKLIEPIPEPETKLGLELEEHIEKANSYLQSKIIVEEFDEKYETLQSNLEANESLIKKSVKIPNLVGMTVEEANREIDKLNLNLSVQGYTNTVYRNGESVPESKRSIETWDGNRQGKILKQQPSFPAYEFIIKGSTIQLIVENQSVEKKIDTSESSSSSTSDTSTTNSTSSTTKDTTSDSTD